MMNFNDADFSKWYSEELSKIVRDYSKQATGGKCYICKEECSSFCNSHSVPQFVLENISKNGLYSTFADIADIKLLKPHTGKNNAGTFRLICKDCDSKFFATYENKKIYDDLSKPISINVLFEIAFKNHLFAINKCNNELSLGVAIINYTEQNNPEYLDIVKQKLHFTLETAALRLNLHEKNYLYDKYCMDKHMCAYKIVDQFELPYVVPIAFQSEIPMFKDLRGNIVNHFEIEALEVLYMLHVCIFPLKNKTRILLFRHETDTAYDQFQEDFRQMTQEKKLNVLNFMIFQYSEDFYCNQEVAQKYKQNRELVRFCQEQKFCNLSVFDNYKLPNILTEQL